MRIFNNSNNIFKIKMIEKKRKEMTRDHGIILSEMESGNEIDAEDIL